MIESMKVWNSVSSGGASTYRDVTIRDPYGLHAVTAQKIVALIDSPGKVFIARAEEPLHVADASRLLAILGLGISGGETVRISCSWPHAASVLQEVALLLGNDQDD